MKKRFLPLLLIGLFALCLLFTSCELLEESGFPMPVQNTEEPAQSDKTEDPDTTETPETPETPPVQHTHSWDEGKVTKAPTCKEAGTKVYSCKGCDQTKSESIPKTADHTWGEGLVTKGATCAEEGEKTFTCTLCGIAKTEPIEKTTDHVWDAGVVTTAPTTTKEGVKTYTCTLCSATKEEKIAKLKNPNAVAVTPDRVVVGKAVYQLNPDQKTYRLYSVLDENITELTIQSSVSGKKVTAIDWEACFELTKLAKLTIGSNVTKIGERAFMGCTSLTSITIPRNVEIIDEEAFMGCTSLASISIPDSVYDIGSAAFKDCTALQVVTIGKGVEELPEDAFSGCDQIAFLTLGDGLTAITNEHFKDADRSLIKVTIGINLETTKANTDGAKYAFSDAVHYKLVSIVDGTEGTVYLDADVKAVVDSKGSVTTTADNFVFYKDKPGNCFLMTYTGKGVDNPKDPTEDPDVAAKILVLPADYSEKPYAIYPYAFYGRTDIGKIYLNEINRNDGDVYKISGIGAEAFSGCTSLAILEVADSITSIGQKAFYGCESLTSIEIPNSVTSIGGYAFEYCYNLSEIIYKGTEAEWNAIEKGEYWDCDSGRDTEAGKYTLIFRPAFEGEGLAFTSNGDGTCYVSGCGTLESTDLIIPETSPAGETVVAIGAGAFRGKTLTSLLIPASVTEIKAGAFLNVTALEKVYYAGGMVAWESILIGENNASLLSATIYYYSAAQPAVAGNFWHYVESVPTAWPPVDDNYGELIPLN